MKNEMAEFSD